MTYDSWKAHNPESDLLGSGLRDQPDELELVYRDLKAAEERIAELEEFVERVKRLVIGWTDSIDGLKTDARALLAKGRQVSLEHQINQEAP